MLQKSVIAIHTGNQMEQKGEVVDGITGRTLLQAGVAKLQTLMERWKALRCCQRRQHYADQLKSHATSGEMGMGAGNGGVGDRKIDLDTFDFKGQLRDLCGQGVPRLHPEDQIWPFLVTDPPPLMSLCITQN